MQEREFWDKRAIEIRSFLILGNLGVLIVGQLKGYMALFKLGQMHAVMQGFYTLVTLVEAFVIYKSYKDRSYLRYMRELTTLIIIRFMIRGLDLEGTGALMGLQKWSWFMSRQTSYARTYSILMMLCFEKTKMMIFQSIFSITFISLMEMISLLGSSQTFARENIPELLLQMAFINVLCYVVVSSSTHHSDFLEQMVNFLESQDIFKKILNNFREPLLIFSNSKADFVNKIFSEQFKDKLEAHNIEFDEQKNQILKKDLSADQRSVLREKWSSLKMILCCCLKT